MPDPCPPRPGRWIYDRGSWGYVENVATLAEIWPIFGGWRVEVGGVPLAHRPVHLGEAKRLALEVLDRKREEIDAEHEQAWDELGAKPKKE